MALRFAKYEGLGNDFLIVALDADVDAARAQALCDRHLGVGADGVLFAGARGGRAFMRVLNADGSTAEMCGNGLRCVAWHLVRVGLAERDLTIETDAGPHRCRVLADGRVEVEMAVPALRPPEVPVLADAPLVDAPLDVDGRTVHVTAVSMGNPHAVTFDPYDEATRAALGPRLERDDRFPNAVNVGFARVTPAGLELAVWERGVGFTRACGTGACAAAVAAVETGRAERGAPLSVRLPGGELLIEVGAPGERVRMTGPARHVFDGELA